MRLLHHVAASIPLGFAVKFIGGSNEYALISVVSSIVIDLDHIPDYMLTTKGWYGVKDFFSFCSRSGFDRVYFVLHAWEWAILLCCGGFFGAISPCLVAIGSGLAYHLAFDTIGNATSPKFYWFSYRASKNFSANKLLSSVRPKIHRGGLNKV
ncbi:MAG: hypothetical protein HQK81_15630 [Desulfovibrionaceae bacterium]|nr:hypothetical protein [Desulfovibrionaceae bacterium]MBF0515473.1 hypothetical protein [Desulfovibrionaceae bacterium]